MSGDTLTIHWFHKARSQADDPSHFSQACGKARRYDIGGRIFSRSSPQFLDHGCHTAPGVKDIIHNQKGSIIGDATDEVTKPIHAYG